MDILKNNKEEIKREADCLKQLKSYIKENGDFDTYSEFLDERFLLHFIRGKKYDVKKAFSTLKNYFSIRTSNAFQEIIPSKNQALSAGAVRVLKSTDSHGRGVIVARVKQWNPPKMTLEDCFQAGILIAEEAWNSENIEQIGVILIFDLAGFNFEHAKACTPLQIHRLIKIFWNSLPLKYKSIHVVNEIYLFTAMFRTIKPFLQKKLQERLHMHGSDLKSLHQHVSPEALPLFLGGSLADEESFDLDLEDRIRGKEEYYKRFAQKHKSNA